MNGVHDMGGMHGMGPLLNERNEPVFHHPWEGRVFALSSAAGAWRRWNIDAGRSSIESLPAVDYLRMSYYERWFAALIHRLERYGLVTRAEIESCQPEPGAAKAAAPLTPDMVAARIAAGSSTERSLNNSARFSVGGQVRARKINPTGHTRLPRYARGKLGSIERVHGGHVFPDTNAAFTGEHPQYLYSVRFSARELWGESASPRDAVYLDLWEEYLEATVSS